MYILSSFFLLLVSYKLLQWENIETLFKINKQCGVSLLEMNKWAIFVLKRSSGAPGSLG